MKTGTSALGVVVKFRKMFFLDGFMGLIKGGYNFI